MINTGGEENTDTLVLLGVDLSEIAIRSLAGNNRTDPDREIPSIGYHTREMQNRIQQRNHHNHQS